MDNISSEVLTDIRALADQFLIAFPNINIHFLTPLTCIFSVTLVVEQGKSYQRELVS